MLKPYRKTPLTFNQQLALLKQPGMAFNDDSTALSYLSSINYYRLSSYWFPFRVQDSLGQRSHQFVEGTHFWMLTEVMSFGALSFFYAGLQNDKKIGKQDKAAVSSIFNLHHKRLGDWLHKLTYVRNVCAHHSRLWNRELAIRPDKVKENLWLPPITPRNDRIFYILLMMRYLLRNVKGGDEWAMQMNQLLEPVCETSFYRTSMGMPVDWKHHPLWR
ncbi:Abi family protein [Thiomicrospira microaerophila]|uniref:Abi family protein n=1 Tax=Thiomicrospira microaerophila TaxID=406020 RepID=UPI00200CA3C4|nr:Abi family protein [Thiomicrospira microaerophila]UQB43357.1 Abi family protein [Thiomicrospira microaerophila]